MTGAELEAAVAKCVRTVRELGRQPLNVLLHPDDTVLLATQVRPRPTGPLLGCGLAVDVDGYLVTVFADRTCEPGRVRIGSYPGRVGSA